MSEEFLPQNNHWLNRVSKEKLSEANVPLSRHILYVAQLMWWGLENEPQAVQDVVHAGIKYLPELESMVFNLMPDQVTDPKCHANHAMQLLMSESEPGEYGVNREEFEQEDLLGASLLALEMLHCRLIELIDGYPWYPKDPVPRGILR